MSVGTPEFDHYIPADWLLRNPASLDADTAEIANTQKTFEIAIAALNKCLPAK